MMGVALLEPGKEQNMNGQNIHTLREKVLELPDGMWVRTDEKMTAILETQPMEAPRPQGLFWWRRKQLLDTIEYSISRGWNTWE